jgi:hypothetical protein
MSLNVQYPPIHLQKSPPPPPPTILKATPLCKPSPPALYQTRSMSPYSLVQYRVLTVNHKMDPVSRTFTLDIKVASPPGRGGEGGS